MIQLEHIEKALREKRDRVAEQVLEALKKSPGGMTRQDLVYTVFDDMSVYYPETQINSHPNDRKARLAIARLRRLGVVIVPAGKAGYRLATDKDDDAVKRFISAQRNAAKARFRLASAAKKAYGVKDITPMNLS